MEEAGGGGGGGVALSAVVLRNLSDKLYEKRKTAAIEVEQTVKNLAVSSSAARTVSGPKPRWRRRDTADS